MTAQPPPKPNSSTPIRDLVLRDIEERVARGLSKYGVMLQAGNGRDALWDAYEEALDLAFYLRQAIEERDSREMQAAIWTCHPGKNCPAWPQCERCGPPRR